MPPKEYPTGYYESFESAFGFIKKELEKLHTQHDESHKELSVKLDNVTSEISTLKIDLVLAKKHMDDDTLHCKMDPNNSQICAAADEVTKHEQWHDAETLKLEKSRKSKRKAIWAAALVMIPVVISGGKSLFTWVYSAVHTKPPIVTSKP